RLSTRRRDRTQREAGRFGRPDVPAAAAVTPRWLALAVPWHTLAAPLTAAAPSHAVADDAATSRAPPDSRAGLEAKLRKTRTGPRWTSPLPRLDPPDAPRTVQGDSRCSSILGHRRTPRTSVYLRTVGVRGSGPCRDGGAWTAAAAAALAARRLWWTSACAAGGVINGDLTGGGGGPQGHALPAPPQQLPWLPDMKVSSASSRVGMSNRLRGTSICFRSSVVAYDSIALTKG
ncbi:unnamed protein product, partial [Ixodes pacificus]